MLITGTRIRFVKELDMKFHDLYADHVSFVYNLMKFLMLTKNFVKSFYAKEL